jgi:hypothetical protein
VKKSLIPVLLAVRLLIIIPVLPAATSDEFLNNKEIFSQDVILIKSSEFLDEKDRSIVKTMSRDEFLILFKLKEPSDIFFDSSRMDKIYIHTNVLSLYLGLEGILKGTKIKNFSDFFNHLILNKDYFSLDSSFLTAVGNTFKNPQSVMIIERKDMSLFIDNEIGTLFNIEGNN